MAEKPTTKSSNEPKWGKLEDPRKPEDVVGVVKRYKVFLSRPFGELELKEFRDINCDGAVIIECFPCVGLVGAMSGKQIVKALKLPLIGVICSDHFPVVSVIQNEQPTHPARIYGNHSLVVFISEMPLHAAPEIIRSLVECIFDFAHRHRCPMIYSLEGIPAPSTLEINGESIEFGLSTGSDEVEDEEPQELVIIDDTLLTRITLREQDAKEKLLNNENKTTPQRLSESPKKMRRPQKKKSQEDELEEKTIEDVAEEMFGKKIHYVSTNIDTAKKLRNLGLVPVVDGVIPGTSGLMISQSVLLDQDVTILLAPTNLILPDPNSVLPVLKILSEMIPDVKLDNVYEEIEKEGTDLHKMISGLVKQTIKEKEKKGGVPFGIYG